MGFKEKINAKFDEIFDFLSMKSSSNYGYIVRKFRIQSFYNNQFMHRDYIQNEAVVYCQNNNLQHINELLLRRKELKNQKNYLLSIGAGIGTTGRFFVNNIYRGRFCGPLTLYSHVGHTPLIRQRDFGEVGVSGHMFRPLKNQNQIIQELVFRNSVHFSNT